MSDFSPIIFVFAMFFISILLVIVAVIVWGLGQLKRARLSYAATQLNDIIKLTNEALRTGSSEQKSAVNTRIEEWDKMFSKELRVEIIKLVGA